MVIHILYVRMAKGDGFSLLLQSAENLIHETMRDVEITHEPVELYKILKFEGMAESGSRAKMLISEGQVRVNGEVETRKRRKIVSGDSIQLFDETIRVQLISAEWNEATIVMPTEIGAKYFLQIIRREK